jgi:predicted nucleotidyltransferase
MVEPKEKIASALTKHPAVRLLLLFGSRARGQAKDDSDWDFGFVAAPDFDSVAFYTDLVLILGTDKVDLADLSRANGLLRYRAASDGVVMYEATPGEYEKFWLQAVNFWCEASTILRTEYAAILEGLKWAQ